MVGKTDPVPCGSELARDDGGSVNAEPADTPLSRASSLPQVLRLALDFVAASRDQLIPINCRTRSSSSTALSISWVRSASSSSM
nr:hypothetical protein C1892_12760 [Pseudomonas sp. MPBD7-1]